jgi:polysaccharide chain length determinant protein (PEP-CTERM system associated)
MEERSLHLLDYLSVVKRRLKWLAIPPVVGVLIGGILALTLPREYESSTTLVVTSPSMASELVKSTPADQAERVRAISHELLSRSVLERVAREEGLVDGSSMDAAVAGIRSRAAVAPAKQIVAPTSRSGPDTFIVKYTGKSPELVQRVTNKLATAFIDEHSKMRETRAEETSAYLSTQLKQSQDRLKEVEERLRKVKEAYMGRLPEQTQANLQMVAGLRQQQESTSMSLRNEQDRLAMIERQIEAMRRGAAEAPLSRGTSALSAQQRLVALRRQLEEASGMYTEKHPEIQHLKSEIAAAEALAKEENSRPLAEREPTLNADPTYRQLLSERETSRLRIREYERSVARAGAAIGSYQSRVDAAPMVEQQLSSLNREYELAKQQYNSLAERHQSAILAEDLERRRAGEQFAILYPAFRPSAPSSPNVPRLMLIATLGGIVLGGLLAFAREYMDRSVHDARALQSQFELPVLAEIPHITAR